MQLELYKPSPIAWKPHAGQRRGMQFLLQHACAGLFAEPGTGKTSTVFGAFKVLKQKKLATKMLVVAPLKPAYLVWPLEQEKWLDFSGLKVQVLHGPTKNEALIADADICVINFDGLEWLLGAKKLTTPSGKVRAAIDLKRFKAFGFDTLVVDELTRFKHSSSLRFQAFKQVLHTFARRWGLTGTPNPNGLLDLFGQCYILDLGNALGQFITHYRGRFFTPGFDGFRYELKPGAAEQIYERLAPLVLTLRAEDYVEMPEVVSIDRWFNLPDPVRRIYDDLEEELIAKVGDNTITAATAGVASGKCRQVANGGIYLEPAIADLLKLRGVSRQREWVDLHEEKVDLLADLVEELQGSPLLVAYDFKHDLARLQKRFGKDVPFIGGGTSPSRGKELEALWNAGRLPLLLGHPQSIAHGLNLQQSGFHVCWHSMTWDFELYDQFIRRVRRQGSKAKKVFVHHLLAKGTVDGLMLRAIQSKRAGHEALFTALKDLAKNKGLQKAGSTIGSNLPARLRAC